MRALCVFGGEKRLPDDLLGVLHGTEVAGANVDGETYRRLTARSAPRFRRINADKRSYLHYFVDSIAKKIRRSAI